MITARDRLILKHIEEYGFITIEQTAEIFMKDRVKRLEIARLRLNSMVASNLVKVTKITAVNRNVYYMNKIPSYHKTLIMDFYMGLLRLGATIHTFKSPYSTMEDKLRSDLFCVFSLLDDKKDRRTYFVFLEVVYTHKDVPIDKYEELCKTNCMQKICGNTFPRIVIMSDDKVKNYNTNLKVIQIGHDLVDLYRIL